MKRKLEISKADVKGLLAELLVFRIRFSISSYKHSKHARSQLGRRLETLWAHTLLFIPPLPALLQLLLVLLLGVVSR